MWYAWSCWQWHKSHKEKETDLKIVKPAVGVLLRIKMWEGDTDVVSQGGLYGPGAVHVAGVGVGEAGALDDAPVARQVVIAGGLVSQVEAPPIVVDVRVELEPELIGLGGNGSRKTRSAELTDLSAVRTFLVDLEVISKWMSENSETRSAELINLSVTRTEDEMRSAELYLVVIYDLIIRNIGTQDQSLVTEVPKPALCWVPHLNWPHTRLKMHSSRAYPIWRFKYLSQVVTYKAC